MPPDSEKPKVDAEPKAPEVEKPTDAEEEAAKTENAGARRDVSDETAQETATDESSLDKLANSLPKNKWTDMYFQLVKQVKLHPELNGPFTNACLAMMLLAAKYAKYMDMIPGAFTASLDTEENLKDKKLSEGEIDTVLKQKKEDPKKTLTDEEKNGFKASGIEKASAQYVANKLFGMTDVDSPQLLSAKIAHATKTVKESVWEVKEGETTEVTVEKEIPYYKSVNLNFLKENGMPFGTVIIFTPDTETGAKVTAYATGNADEVEFIDGNGDVKRANLKLNDPASALIASRYQFQAAFVPMFNSDAEYFAKYPKEVDVRLTEPAEPVPAPVPAAEAEPVPVAGTEPVLVPVPAAVAEPVPVAGTEPVLVPVPAAVAEPVPVAGTEPVLVPVPAAGAEPVPVAGTEPVLVPVPAAEAEPVPAAGTEPALVPVPAAEAVPVVPKPLGPLRNFREEIGKNFHELKDLLNFEGEVFRGVAYGCSFAVKERLIYPKVLSILDDKLSAIGNSVDLEKLAGSASGLSGFPIKIHELVQFIAEAYTASMLQSVDDSFRVKYPLFDTLPNKDNYEIEYTINVVDGGTGFITEFKVDDVFEADYKRVEDAGISIDFTQETVT